MLGYSFLCRLTREWRVGVMLGLFASAVSADTTLALLERMAEASRSLNYDGVFVYRRANGSDSMRLIHRSADQGEAERLLSLSGQSREVVRDGDSVRCFLPNTGELSTERPRTRPLMPTEISRPWTRIAEQYNFSLQGLDRVAGRTTKLIAVQPRSGDRYGYRLWTDEETGLLLRSELVDLEGRALEQMEFTHLDLPASIPDELLMPGPDAVSAQGVPARAQLVVEGAGSNSEVVVNWLPAGFILHHTEVLSGGNPGGNLQHLAYTDGLAVVSVFVEPGANLPQGHRGFTTLGAAVAYTTVRDGFAVTVVGEVPPLTARSIAESVAPH